MKICGRLGWKCILNNRHLVSILVLMRRNYWKRSYKQEGKRNTLKGREWKNKMDGFHSLCSLE
jgi:hypothetical protein